MKSQLEHNGSHTGQVLRNHLNPVAVVIIIINPRSDTLFAWLILRGGYILAHPLKLYIFIYYRFLHSRLYTMMFHFKFIRVEPDTSQQT